MIFDLCTSVLSSPLNAQIAFRSILKKIRSAGRFQNYTVYERSWVLRISCEKLLELSRFHGHQVTAQEQIKLDSDRNVTTRLKQFHLYFYRLIPEDQLLLILKDKYNLPYSEIATALGTPEASLKIKRQQALRALEEWLWIRQ
jgi:DNA-directed RNA polymerase specialized sigma24 family protein